MTPGATSAMLARYGEATVLRRISGRSIFIDVELMARVDNYQPDEIGGGVVQGDQKAILGNVEIAAAQWPGPPRRGDQLVVGGRTRTIEAVITATIDGEDERHDLQIRGN